MTLYFQVQFLKLKCTGNAKSTIKKVLKSERKEVFSLKNRYHQRPEKKCKELKRDITEIQSQKDSIEKGNIRKMYNKKNMKKKKYQKNPKPKEKYEKRTHRENPEQRKHEKRIRKKEICGQSPIKKKI